MQAFAHQDLLLNPEKTVLTLYESRKSHAAAPALLLHDTQVFCQEKVKILGLWTDSALTMSPHVELLEGKLSTSIFVLRSLKRTNTSDTLKLAYFALIESHIRYGIEVWGICSKTNMDRILRKQKKAVRLVAGAQFSESCRPLFKRLKLLTAPALYMLACAFRVHWTVETRERARDIHEHQTRSAHRVINQHTDRRHPEKRAVAIYNLVPDTMKSLPDKEFRKEYRKYLLEKAPYSINV